MADKQLKSISFPGLSDRYVVPEGLNSAQKTALLNCFQHVAWIDDDGQDYYDALYDALYNTTWPVTNTLSHCTTSNASEAVNKGSSYSATITAASGYTLTGATVSITMGGTDITSTAYSNGVISIAAVTGALVITISAAAKTVSSISAVYTQSGIVSSAMDLDELKPDLVVTATYTDSSTDVVPAEDYELSGTLEIGTCTITVTASQATATFTVSVTTDAEYIWDFTESVTDKVRGVTAVCGNCEQTSSGITFNAGTDYISLGEVFGFDKTVEIDYVDASAGFGNVNGIWFWTTNKLVSATNAGFGWRYHTNAANRHYGWYINDASAWYMDTSTAKTFINGSGTLKATISASGVANAYVNDTQVALSGAHKYTNESSASFMFLGSSDSSHPAFYNVTITGVRIYSGVR